MNVSRIPPMSTPPPSPTREEMIAVAASRPAVLQLQQVALAALHRGTTGQGTPGIDGSASIDLYA